MIITKQGMYLTLIIMGDARAHPLISHTHPHHSVSPFF